MGVAGTNEKTDQIPLDPADFFRDVRKIAYVINPFRNFERSPACPSGQGAAMTILSEHLTARQEYP